MWAATQNQTVHHSEPRAHYQMTLTLINIMCLSPSLDRYNSRAGQTLSQPRVGTGSLVSLGLLLSGTRSLWVYCCQGPGLWSLWVYCCQGPGLRSLWVYQVSGLFGSTSGWNQVSGLSGSTRSLVSLGLPLVGTRSLVSLGLLLSGTRSLWVYLWLEPGLWSLWVYQVSLWSTSGGEQVTAGP